LRIELEQSDLEAIAQIVLDTVKPYLVRNPKCNTEEDDIMDMKGLCAYLKVTPKWVHERTRLHEIPFYKLSNKQLRFRKRDIDKWLDSLKTPAITSLSSKVRLCK
jgi:predicted DNA-binding transcriptional regulator AlpA